ncbi:hypothetical protein DU504_15380 [Haloplanus salinus]|uniref:Uncharacterized protein n=1 Tax=Haloplanus salinus TaxID=1126245 RepID=A0A368N1R2_9EURY|nr:hypothetical protein DU504_15380 [Haloplanus salinus]
MIWWPVVRQLVLTVVHQSTERFDPLEPRAARDETGIRVPVDGARVGQFCEEDVVGQYVCAFEVVGILRILVRKCLRCDVVFVLRIVLSNGHEDATAVLVAEYLEQFTQQTVSPFVFFLDIRRWFLLRNASLGDAFRATDARREMDGCERMIPFQAALAAGTKRTVCSVPYYLIVPERQMIVGVIIL